MLAGSRFTSIFLCFYSLARNVICCKAFYLYTLFYFLFIFILVHYYKGQEVRDCLISMLQGLKPVRSSIIRVRQSPETGLYIVLVSNNARK